MIRQHAVYACRSVNTRVSTPTLRLNILNSSQTRYPRTLLRSVPQLYAQHVVNMLARIVTNVSSYEVIRSITCYATVQHARLRHAQVITKKLCPYMQNTLAMSHIHAYYLSVTSGVVLTLGACSRYARTCRSFIFPNPDKLPRYQLRGLLFPPVTMIPRRV
jgi:hypothetical protein